MKKLSHFFSLSIVLLASSQASATDSSLSLAKIDRKTKGKVYQVTLSQSDITRVSLSSLSENPEANIKIYSVKYKLKNTTYNLLEKARFTSESPYSFSYQLSHLNTYSKSQMGLDCDSPCLEFQAEAFKANDVILNIAFESDSHLPAALVKLESFRPTVSDSASVTPPSQSQGEEYLLLKNNFTLKFSDFGTNEKGHSTYGKFTIVDNAKKYALGKDMLTMNNLCHEMGKISGKDHSEYTSFELGQQKVATASVDVQSDTISLIGVKALPVEELSCQ